MPSQKELGKVYGKMRLFWWRVPLLKMAQRNYLVVIIIRHCFGNRNFAPGALKSDKQVMTRDWNS